MRRTVAAMLKDIFNGDSYGIQDKDDRGGSGRHAPYR